MAMKSVNIIVYGPEGNIKEVHFVGTFEVNNSSQLNSLQDMMIGKMEMISEKILKTDEIHYTEYGYGPNRFNQLFTYSDEVTYGIGVDKDQVEYKLIIQMTDTDLDQMVDVTPKGEFI